MQSNTLDVELRRMRWTLAALKFELSLLKFTDVIARKYSPA